MIAEIFSEDREASFVPGIFIDSDPHGDEGRAFQMQVFQRDIRQFFAVHPGIVVSDAKVLEQSVLTVFFIPPLWG